MADRQTSTLTTTCQLLAIDCNQIPRLIIRPKISKGFAMNTTDTSWITIASTSSVSETKLVAAALATVVAPGDVITLDGRSEERRVGKEC